MPLEIASFNINGIRARLPRLLEWLDDTRPDIACLQEIKIADEAFPHAPFEERGYNVAVNGQKGFNGVAILSRLPLEDVGRGLPDGEADVEGLGDEGQSRFISALVSTESGALRICNLYAPNGNPAPGPKFDYKLRWMERLRHHAAATLAREETALYCGDWNVIPQPEDARHPDEWLGDALFRPESRAAFRRILHLGYTDALRARSDSADLYTFWDYKGGAWRRNDGIRIDHFLLTPQCADHLLDCRIEKEQRAKEKPSDHVPIRVVLDLAPPGGA